MRSATDNTARTPGGRDPRMSATAAHLSEAARLASDAHRMLVASVLSLEAAEVEIAPAAELEIAELLDDTDAYASELLRVAGGNHDHLVHHDRSNDHLVRALDLPELPYSDGTYVEMWDRVATEWRDATASGNCATRGARALRPDQCRSAKAARLSRGRAGNAARCDRSFPGTAGGA